MKVTHVITGLMAGGAEHTLFRLLANGLANGIEHSVISLGGDGIYGPKIRALGIPVQAVGMRSIFLTAVDVFKLRKMVQRARPNLIQGWMYHGNLAATLVRSFVHRRPALIWNVRQSLYDLSIEKIGTRGVIRLGRSLSRRPEAIIYNSMCSREQHEAFGFWGAQSHVIPNGFEVPLTAESRKAEVRGWLGLPVSAKVVGHVARFHPMKDHVLFLRAAVRIAKSMDDVYFLLVGRGVTFQNAILSEIIPLDVRHRFVLLGERRDVPEIMQSLDLLCQSSWSEAFPNVLGEAMAMGVPCVATDVGDSAYIVGDTGVIVPPRDEEALISGLTALLSRNNQVRKALGSEARARIAAEFSLSVAVQRYVSLYDAMTPSGPRPYASV